MKLAVNLCKTSLHLSLFEKWKVKRNILRVLGVADSIFLSVCVTVSGQLCNPPF